MIEALRSVCRDVCGPAGTSAVVRSDSGSGVTLTACGSRLLGAFAEHPVPGVVVQNTCAAQQAIYGEGGLTSTILACTLIRLTSELGARRRTDHLLLADTFQRCLGWCYECLESTSGGTQIFFRVPFRRGGDDEEAFAALARTVLFPKLLAVSDARAMDAIADALVRSFVADGDADEATKLDREGFVDGLRVLEIVGAPRECARRAPGVFVARAPVMDFDFARLAGNEAGTHSAGGRVLIVAESMRLPSGPERTRRAAAAAEIARACETLGVRVVLCSRAVDRHLQQLLARRGVLPLERVPAADLAAVAHATGARPLEQWATSATGECDSARAGAEKRGGETRTKTSASYAAEWAPNVGAYEGVVPATLEGNPPVKYVKMRGSARALDTLLLCAPTVPEMEELAAVVASARRALARLAAEPDAVAGGGAVETALAARVRARAAEERSVLFLERSSREATLESEAVHAFAAALEETAVLSGAEAEKRRGAEERRRLRRLFPGAVASVLESFREDEHSPTLSRNPPRGPLEGRLDRSQPVESLGAKMEGIRKAVEVACVVLRTHAE